MKCRGRGRERHEISEGTEAKVLSRMMAPRNEAVSVLAREFNITTATLYGWRQIALKGGVAAPGDGRNAEEWRGSAKFAVVLETAALAEAELGEYCRARGLFPEQVRSWRAVCGYHTRHQHSALKFVTPTQRHEGTDIDILEARKTLYEAAKAAKPERWRGSTRNWERPTTVWLNPVRQENRPVKLAA